MLEEFRRNIFVDIILLCQLQSDAHQIQTVHRHPTGPVGLIDISAGRQRSAPIKYSDVIEAEEPALEDVASGSILAIDPPREIQHQLVEDALQKCKVPRIIRTPAAPVLAVDLKNPP